MRKHQRWAAMCCALAMLCGSIGFGLAEGTEKAVPSSRIVYGLSEQGRELVCHAVGNREAGLSLLMIFGVHGFEDAFDRDGEVLALIAQRLIEHYAQAQDICLYVVPTANPDGLLAGTTKDGFGRCNASGIDINRDFSVDWSRETLDRNRTGKEPFATAEARAIRDLVETLQPDYAMDVHGWCQLSFGNGKMAQIFAQPFGFEVRRLCGGGMLCAWLNRYTTESIMLELPPQPNKEDYVTDTASRLIEGLDAWVEHCSSR